MTLQYLTRCIFFVFFLFVANTTLHATVDAETPEQELEILRLILLEKDVHAVLAKMKMAGCVWHSEFIWFYAPEKIDENRYRWGGEFVLQFESRYSPEKSVRFSFVGVHTSSGRSVDSIKFLSDESFYERCH